MTDPLPIAIQLFNDREFFRCHEVLEEVWTHESNPRRLFLQTLIHFAVGFYHWQRGNFTGAALQLRKGLRKIERYLPAREGIDTARLQHDVIAALAALASPHLTLPQIHLLTEPGEAFPSVP